MWPTNIKLKVIFKNQSKIKMALSMKNKYSGTTCI